MRARLWLKEARKARGLTAEALAREIGVTLGTVFQWEACKKAPRIPTQRELGRILGIDAVAAFAAEADLMRQSA